VDVIQEEDKPFTEVHSACLTTAQHGSCKACDVNPREWLTDVLTRIPEYNNNYNLDLADLLPHNWKKLKSLQQTPKDFGDN
jgi:hypothetical protein